MDEEKPTLEETLQSMDDTLKRIEKMILDQMSPKSFVFSAPDRNANDLVKEYTKKGIS